MTWTAARLHYDESRRPVPSADGTMWTRTHTTDPNQPVVIRTYPNEYEAELGRIVLESAEDADA